MPDPAGTGLDRRAFLSRSTGLALTVFGAGSLPGSFFDASIAEASGVNNPVLVSVFLDGGIDQLSVLAPVADSTYIANRPTLKLAPNSAHRFSGDTRLQWHPSAFPLQSLYAQGKLAVFPSIGYIGPDESHFTSRHYWQVGAHDQLLNTGWLGRYLELHGAADNPLQGLSLAPTLAPALATVSAPVAAMINPRDFQLSAPGVGDEHLDLLYRAYGEAGAANSGDEAIETARRVVRNTSQLRSQISGFAGAEVASDTSFAFDAKLTLIADMLDAGLPLRCVSLTAPGLYDTHAAQLTNFGTNLQTTVDGLVAFQSALESRGHADRVITLIWSEFGRRIKENGTGSNVGTDHGAAGVGFLMGNKVRGGVYGGWPGLPGSVGFDTVQTATQDFRPVYVNLLDKWFGVDPGPIIPNADSFGAGVLSIPDLIV